MKKYVAIFMVSSYSLLSAMNVIQLPSAEILKNRLDKKGLKDLIDKSNIHKDYGDKQIYPEGAVKMFELAATSYYFKSEKTPATTKQLKIWKPVFIKTVLEDHPKA